MTKVNDEVNDYPKAKEGLHLLKVLSVSEPTATAKSHYRKWILQVLDEDIRPLHVNMFPWEAKDLLLNLGLDYKLENGKIEWDTDDVTNCKFKAVLTYNPSQNDPNKTYPKLTMFQSYKNKDKDEEIPF